MEKTEFVYNSAIDLLKEQHRLRTSPHKIEERQVIATKESTEIVTCFVNKIDAAKSKVEMCDSTHSIQCKFVGELAKKQLASFIRDQTEDINILGLLGRQLELKEACMRIVIKKDIDPLTHQAQSIVKLRLNIYNFEILKTQWDCNVPARLTPVEEDMCIDTLLKKKMYDCQKRVFLEKLPSEKESLPDMKLLQSKAI